MEEPGPRPAGQEIDSPPAQRAGARSGEQEVNSAFFDQPVDFVPELRQPLNLVNDDRPGLRRKLFREASRILAQGKPGGAFQEVVDGVPGNDWRINVVFPVCRGPNRKWDFFASNPARSRARATKIGSVGAVVISPVI